jgi:hypothetical protein
MIVTATADGEVIAARRVTAPPIVPLTDLPGTAAAPITLPAGTGTDTAPTAPSGTPPTGAGAAPAPTATTPATAAAKPSKPPVP